MASTRCFARSLAPTTPTHGVSRRCSSCGAPHAGDSILAFSESATTVRAYWSAMRGEHGVGLLTAREARIASGASHARRCSRPIRAAGAGCALAQARERVTLLLATDLLSRG
jgi:hypothetical protein